MTDFNIIERKKQIVQCEGFLRKVFPVNWYFIQSPSDSYVCFVAGSKGSGKTTLANQMLKAPKGKFPQSFNFPTVIVRVDGAVDSGMSRSEYGDRLKVYEKIRASFRLSHVGTFQYYDQRENVSKEIIEKLNLYILEKIEKVDDADKKEIQKATADGIIALLDILARALMGAIVVDTITQFRSLANKIAVAGLESVTEKVFYFYKEWKSKNAKDHNVLQNYYKIARESFHKDIREISSQKDRRIAILFDDVDAMDDCMKDLGDIIKSTEGRVLWVLVGKKEKLLAFRKEWSGFISSELIETEPFKSNDIKMHMLKGRDANEYSLEIERIADSIHKCTSGNPELVSIFLKLWDDSSTKDKQSFKVYFKGEKTRGITSAIETSLEILKARGERETEFINMLFLLGVLSGNVGNLLYRNHKYGVEYDILSNVGGESYNQIQKDGFIYKTDEGHYAMQGIWNSHLRVLLEKKYFRKQYKIFLDEVNNAAMRCLGEKQEKICSRDALLEKKATHENWVRFEFARCYHKLWCDEEEAWRDIIRILAVAWRYQPKAYPDFIKVINEVSKIISRDHEEEFNLLRNLMSKPLKANDKRKAFEVFRIHAGSDPDILEIIGQSHKQSSENKGVTKETVSIDDVKIKESDGGQEGGKLNSEVPDVYLASLSEIDEHIKNKEHGVAKEKINRTLSNPNIAYRNRFYCKLADCYREEKKFKEASDVYQKIYLEVTSEKEKDYVVSLGLGWGFYILHLNAKNIEQVTSSMLLNNAETCFNFAVENSDKDKKNEVRIERAEFWKKRSLWDNAFSDYHMVTLDEHALPFYATIAWEGKGNIKIIQEDYITAMDCYSKASIETPNGLLNKSYIYYRNGNKVSALDCIRNCRRLIQSRDSLDTILSPILFYHHIWWFGYGETLNMVSVFQEKQPKTSYNDKEAKLKLDNYMIAKIESLEACINEDDVGDDSPVVKRLRELIKEKPEIIEQIKNDRFFEYIRLQPMYHGLIGVDAKGTENNSTINSNNDGDSLLVLL